MSDTNAVPAPTPENPALKAENKAEKFLASVGLGMIIALAVILVTEMFGVTDFYKRFTTPLEARTATATVAEAPQKQAAPKVEAPTTTTTEAPKGAVRSEAPASISVVQNCNTEPKRVVVAKRPVVKKPVAKPATPETPKVKEMVVSPAPERIWLWHAHDATSENPKPCIIEYGDGRGLPPYCSGLKSVIPRIDGETKHQWLVRVGGGHKPTDTPLYQKKG